MQRLTPQEFEKTCRPISAGESLQAYTHYLMDAYAEHLDQTAWVELDQVVRMGDCANLPLFGVEVIVEYNGTKRLDALIKYAPDDTEGVWRSCGDFRPNARAERWCYIPNPPNK